MANTIQVELDLDVDQATGEIKRFGGNAKKAGEKAGDNFADGFAKSLKGIAKVATGAAAIIGSIGAALTFKESKIGRASCRERV